MLLSFSEGINVWWHDGMMVRRQRSAERRAQGSGLRAQGAERDLASSAFNAAKV